MWGSFLSILLDFIMYHHSSQFICHAYFMNYFALFFRVDSHKVILFFNIVILHFNLVMYWCSGSMFKNMLFVLIVNYLTFFFLSLMLDNSLSDYLISWFFLPMNLPWDTILTEVPVNWLYEVTLPVQFPNVNIPTTCNYLS